MDKPSYRGDKSEKISYHITTCNLKKMVRMNLLENNRDTDVESKRMDTGAEGRVG